MKRFLFALAVLLWSSTAFAQPPKATLDQARNGTASSPVSPVDFQNGNLGGSNAHYAECTSAPYRLAMENFALGAHYVIIEWDIKNSGAHAIDYITEYDQVQPHNFSPAHSQEVIDPLEGLAGTWGSPSTFPIPAPSSAGSPVTGQPTAAFNSLPPADRVMTIWNGTITGMSYVSEGSLTAANSSTQLRIDFTATSPNVVLAWGGHLASRAVWGNGNSAGGISGSPFHMRLIEFDGTGGNQDRSLSAVAVLPDPLADLSLVKTVNPVTAQVGSTVTFTIAVTNSGPDVATNVTVGDVIPSGYTYVAGSIAGGSSRSFTAPATLSWTINSLAVGATTNLTFQAVVNATGNYTNVAQVTAADQKDPDSAPNNENGAPYEDDEDDAVVTPIPVADLSLVKSVNNPTATVGSTVTFTIAVTNNGPSTATNVSVGDVIPSGFTYVAGSIAGGSTRSDAGAPTLSWSIASLASGATTNLTFQAVVNATGIYTNVAEVTASDQNDPDSQPDPTPDNDTPTQDDEDDVTVVPTPVADLSLVKSVNNPTATVGSTVTFTIAVTNNGPSTATNVSVGDVIPSGFTYVAGSISGGSSRSDASAPTLSWTIASLASGATTNLTFQAVVNATGIYTNVAEVTASDQNDPDSQPDPTPDNDTPTQDDEDDVTVVPTPVADLSLVKSVNNPTASVGSTVTFTIAVTNNGPSTATNVSVGDVIPSGFTYVAGSIAGGTSRSDASAPTLSWSINSIASGATVNLTYQAIVNATGNYTNVAQVTDSDQPDPDSAPNNNDPAEDDQDSETVTPTPVADLSLVKSVDNATASVGSTVTFTIAVTNNGPSTATNVSVGDVIPTGFSYVAGSIAGGTNRSDASAPTLSWSINSIASGATVNLTYQAIVNATGNYTNVAEVTASDQNDPDSQPDPTPDNDTPTQDDEDDVTVVPTPVADLSLVKSVNNPTANVGSTVTFTIAVTNNGPSTATNVSVGDVIPSGFTYVAGSIAGGSTRSDASAPTLSWSINSIASGATVNLTYQAIVNATGNYTNVAQVTDSDQPDPDSEPNNNDPTEDDQDNETVTPTPVADLSLVKSVNNPTATVGSTVTFTIAVTNNGPSTATNVSVGDVIPSGFTYVAGSISGGSSRSDASAPTLSWTISSLANGVTINLTFQAVVNATGNYTNVAQVTASDQPDPDSAPNNENGAPYEDDEDDATVTPQQGTLVDLCLQKSVNNPTASIGSTVTFTIAVTNYGPGTATNVSIGDVIPSGFTYVPNSITGGTTRSDAGAPTLSWTFGSLVKDATVSVTFQAVVNATGNYTNVVQITAADQQDIDSTPNNEDGAPYEDDEDDATVTPAAVADLSLQKSVNNATVNAGTTVTFTIAVTNNGPSVATNVSVSDVIPSGFTYVAGSITGGTTRSIGGLPTLSWTINSLANGATENLTFQAVVNATGNHTNVAQVTASDQLDPDSAPNNENGAPYEDDEDDVTVTPIVMADLSLAKSVNDPNAEVGSTVTFSIAVTNNGPNAATNVSVGDVIPSGFTYVAGSIAGGSSRSAANAPTLSWTIGSLANGAATNLTFQAVVNAAGNHTNVAQVTASDQPDPDSAPNNENGAPYEDDEDDASVTPQPATADLRLKKSVDNSTPVFGETVTFTITVTNDGPSTATNVSVGDVIPNGFTYVPNSITGGSSRSAANAPTLTWTIASLASGASTNLTFQAVVNATGNYTNVAQVTASDQPDPDSSPNNNNGAPYEDDEDDAVVTPQAPAADLSLKKSVDNANPAFGEAVTFTITVTNDGPSTATNVKVADVVPSGYTYVAGSIAGGSSRSDANAPTLSWTISSLANGASVKLTFKAVVNATGNYVNVAQVTASDQPDPDSSPNNDNGAPYEDDEDDAKVTPTAEADLSLKKSVSNATAAYGQTVTFTIAVTNDGPNTATNVKVGDVVPSGFTYVAGSIAGGSSRSDVNAPTLSWTINSIANGATVNLSFKAVVNSTGNYTNVAQVTASDQPDDDSTPNNEDGAPYEDDEDDATVTPTAVADLSLKKSVNNATAAAGQTVTFTIVVTNSGPGAATNVSVGDVVPSGFTYVAGSIAGGTSRSDANAPTLSWTISSIAKGASVNLTFQAVVNASGVYKNVAQVTASDQPDLDSTPNNEDGAPYEDDEDDAIVTPKPVADLSLQKSVDNATANVGSTVTFTIAVTNNGPSTATNVKVSDVIPSGFTYVANSIAGGSSRSASSAPTLSWTINSLANGATVNLTFKAVVKATGNYTNVAQVKASDQYDPDSTPNNENGAPYEDDEDDATVTPIAVADLSLQKTVDNPAAQVGSTVTFTIAVTNSGPSTATNVMVGDVVGCGFTYVANSIAGGASRSDANAPSLTWTISSLANGATVNLTFRAVVSACGIYKNVAQVTASDQIDPDSSPNNEDGTPYEDDEDEATVTPTGLADLSLQKSVNNATAYYGSTVTFTIAVTNSGPNTATNVTVSDVIPSGFTYVANSIVGGTTRSDAGAPGLSWTLSSLANGAVVNLSFQAVVNSSGVYKNVAQVTAADQNDPDSSPNNENGSPYEDDEDEATVTPTLSTTTFNPNADTYVRSDASTTNYGTEKVLKVRQSSAIYYSFLKFNVSGLTGNIVSAKLRLKVTTASNDGGAVYSVSNNYLGTSTAWTETGLKYNNAPTISGSPLSSAGAVTLGQTVEFDVTSAITGNGAFSFGLKNASSTTVQYSSKEGGTRPELVIQTTSPFSKPADSAPSVAAQVPERLELRPNYPNPFNAQTLIEYSLPEASNVRLVIYTITGQFVRTLVDEDQPASYQRVLWDGKNARGEEVSSGVYLYVLEVGRERMTRRMVFQK